VTPAYDQGVTVVLPVLDEEATVGAALESLANQSVGADTLEVLVYDGGSSDRTAEVARSFEFAAPWRRFEVNHNSHRTVPHALNAALRSSRCTWFTRLDGRTAFSENYIEACVQAVSSGDGVTSPTIRSRSGVWRMSARSADSTPILFATRTTNSA
jgi:succinoglycan biosynthesis protein ExoA